MKKIVHFCVLTAIGSLSNATVIAAETTADTLPPARSGECYAKVSVPPVYKIEEFEVDIKEGTETIEITPATFETVIEKVMIKEASIRLETTPAEYETVAEQVLIADADQVWMRQSESGDAQWPASKGLLADLTDAGIALQEVPVDSCFYEHVADAGYEDATQQVLIADATDELSVKPAQFATVSKQILLKPAYQELDAFAAQYSAVSEEVIVEAAHSAWKPGRGPIERIDNTTGEIMCRVDVPAVYESVDKQIIKQPAGVSAKRIPAQFDAISIETLISDDIEVREPVPAKYATIKRLKKVREPSYHWLPQSTNDSEQFGQPTGSAVCLREVPAQYETVERQVLKTPAAFTQIEEPAVYEEVSVEKLVSQASEQRIPVAAKTREMIRRVKVSDARMEWRPVLCETNMSIDIVRQIQRELNELGYNAGKVDGVLGRGTMRAIESYQEDENLALGGLTYTTLESLGIEVVK